MELKITLEEAQKHPQSVDRIMADLAKGKSRHRTAKPDELFWSYRWGLRIEGSGTIGEVLDRAGRPRKKMTVDEATADQVRLITPVTLSATIGRWRGYAQAPITPAPPAVVEYIRACCQRLADDVAKEQALLAALTPEEREEKFQDELRKLRGGKGFVEVYVDMGGEKP